MNLNWEQKLSLINHYKPSIKQSSKVFGNSEHQIKAALNQQDMGTLIASKDVDVKKFHNVFNLNKQKTKKQTTVVKRGHKTNKIINAFKLINNKPQPIQEFAKKHNISITVCKQTKRFDKNPELGKICIKNGLIFRSSKTNH